MKKIFIIIAIAFSICSCDKFSGDIKSIDEGIITKIDTTSYAGNYSEITLGQIRYPVPNTKDYVYEQDLLVGDHVFICERDGAFLISTLCPKQMQLAKKVASVCNKLDKGIEPFLWVIVIGIISAGLSHFCKGISKLGDNYIIIIFVFIVPFLITYYWGRKDTLEFVTTGKVEQVTDNQIDIDSKCFQLNYKRDVISKQPLQNITSACILKYNDKYYATAENLQNIDGNEIYKIRFLFFYTIAYFIVYFIFLVNLRYEGGAGCHICDDPDDQQSDDSDNHYYNEIL